MRLLPPAADCCQVCAVDHAPHEPHNPDSLYWQMARQMVGEPAPTWDDALAHVAEPLRGLWAAELAKHGVLVGVAQEEVRAS